ncbi:MAG TPA: efflux transporter outer membrane subunit [Xanthobacteraceae bacterium]|jgi:NodT family efflux transporter outer membrane factor (OMF) lipoprotein
MFTRLGGLLSSVEATGFRRRRIAFAAPALLLVLSGCISEQFTLDVGIPLRYRDAPKVDRSPPPALDWWRGFRTKELIELMEEAQTANFDIEAAIARIVEADAQAKIASAPLFPSVTADASAVRTRTAGPNTAQHEHVTYTVAPVSSASYQVDLWGRNRALSRAAQYNAVAVRFDRDVVNLTTLVSVATAYFLVATDQERLRVARQNLAASDRILTLIKQRFAAGTASALNVAQQEALVDQIRANIPPLDEVIRQNKAALALLIGRAPALTNIRGTALYSIGIPQVNPGLPSELLRQRPDVREAEELLAMAGANVEAAREAFYPQIALTGQYGFMSMALKNLFTPQQIFYQVAATLTQPLFDGFLLEGQLENAKGRQNELLADYRKSIVAGFTDVEQALIAVADTTQTERLQRQAVAASQRAFDLSEMQLREGTIDLVTLLQTQETLFTAQDLLVQDRLARLNAVLSLFQALGGGWYPAPPHVPDRARHVADGGRTIDEVLLASPPGLGNIATPVGADDGRTVDEVLLEPRPSARDVAEAR